MPSASTEEASEPPTDGPREPAVHADPPAPSKVLVAGALLAVYVVWGSTYYAMRVALEFLPPFLMAGPRFLIAGGLLFTILRARGAPLPTKRQWGSAAVVGVLLLVCGNGFVALAERSIDSGVAATVVATMPLWASAMGLLWGEKPTVRELVGLVVGFLGVMILRGSGNLSFGSVDSIVLLLAPVTWAFGSVWSRRLSMPSGMMSAAAQMIVAGVVMVALALVRGERPHGPASFEGLFALGYLVVFGSMLGFTAYAFLLRATRPSIATSYAYVNPLVALAIGSVLGGERFTASKVVACVLTILGVLVVSAPRLRRSS